MEQQSEELNISVSCLQLFCAIVKHCKCEVKNLLENLKKSFDVLNYLQNEVICRRTYLRDREKLQIELEREEKKNNDGIYKVILQRLIALSAHQEKKERAEGKKNK